MDTQMFNAGNLGQFSVISNAFLILPLFDKAAVNICICLGVFIDILVWSFLKQETCTRRTAYLIIHEHHIVGGYF